MVEKIRKALRLGHTNLDEEIQDTINACKLNLQLAGIVWIEDDPLILHAVKLYCRWQFNFENKAERYEKAYESQKVSMALGGEYRDE